MTSTSPMATWRWLSPGVPLTITASPGAEGREWATSINVRAGRIQLARVVVSGTDTIETARRKPSATANVNRTLWEGKLDVIHEWSFDWAKIRRD